MDLPATAVAMITPAQIETAKRRLRLKDPHPEHDDCIRIAYEWLDAQKKLKHPRSSMLALKHCIEAWAGRYVSQSDVEVAAELHPEIKGRYPNYNISSKLVEPAQSRLNDVGEAHTQPNYRERDARRYASRES